MNTIWKYQLEAQLGPQTLALPEGASVLDAQVQDDSIALWAVVDPTAAPVDRHFIMFFTGGEMPLTFEDWGYVATLTLGAFVIHIFEDVV